MLLFRTASFLQNPFPTDNFKKYNKKSNPKITILEILVYKIQPEIITSKIFTRFSFITKPCSYECADLPTPGMSTVTANSRPTTHVDSVAVLSTLIIIAQSDIRDIGR